MIDPNEAPEGFVAEPHLNCRFCALYGTPFEQTKMCVDSACMEFERADKTDVQFRKIEKMEGGK